MFDVKPITSQIHLDCGPTCLKMLLEYYGISVSLEELNRECNVRLRGCTARDIKRTGIAHGLDIQIWADSTDEQVDELINQDRPAIIWWKYNHFCVFCGKDDKGDVVICNPDRGRYSLSVGTFKSFYSGVSITHGTPEVLPEEPSDQVTLTQSEYNDIMDVVNQAEEVFASETGE